MDPNNSLLTDLIAPLDAAQSGDPHHLSRAKSRVARHLRAVRARAMLEAADLASGPVPPWMLSAHPFVAEWIRWTSSLNAIVAAARGQPLASGRVEVRRTVNGRTTTLRGGIYMGTLTGALDLSPRPVTRYVDEPTPKIMIARTELPETAAARISKRTDQSNRGWRLSDIIDQPFVIAYDPPVTSFANVDGAVEIALEPGYVTLAPVPVAAMRVVPPDADPGRPWELTPRELDALRSWMPTIATGC